MSPSDREDQSTAAQVPSAGPPARERSSGEREDSTSQDPTAALLDAIRQLTTRIDAIEKAVTPQRGRQGAVSPELPQRRESIFRQAIDHGSMGMQRMQLDELGGVQTPGAFARGSFYGGAPQPQYQAHRPPPVQTVERDAAAAIPPAQAPHRAVNHVEGNNPYGYPSHSQSKLSIRDFDGRETYKGLGAGFQQWVLMFIGQVEMSERACGFRWPEEVKLNKLGQHLTGRAGRFFQGQAGTWWAVCPYLFYALEQMNATFTVRLSMEDAAIMFVAPKEASRSWNDHFLYLIALMRATDASPAMVLQNIVRHASPRFSPTLLGRYDEQRQDYMLHAQELVQFAQRFDVGNIDRRTAGKDVVNAVEDARKCYNCNEVGHIARACPHPKRAKTTKAGGASKANWTLAATTSDRGDGDQRWIVDSGASRHLVNDVSLLRDARDCVGAFSLTLPDGATLPVTKVGSVQFQGRVNGENATITVNEVYYAPLLARNLLSLGQLARRGCTLATVSDGLAITHAQTKQVVFRVTFEDDVLVADVRAVPESISTRDHFAMTATVDSIPTDEVQQDTLMNFHERLGHLALDTVERIARDPHSGIEITDHTRSPCIVCAEGKQTKRTQSKKDTGAHSPIECIGGVICSDLKGPMTPRDRSGNRYLVKFVDHRSNYCRVFAAKTKDVAARKFREFLVFFQKRFACKIYVLRTDGGGEYRTVDLFCKQEGVSRQVSEASNQASNGKAERMHRTIFNMVRCMIFDSKLAPTFWSDAAEYVTYILNRSPTRANEARLSPLEVLTGKSPSLSDVVAFGTTCTVRRDPKKKTLKKRAVLGHVIGKDDVTKGYRIYLPGDRIVVVTQHVEQLDKSLPTSSSATSKHIAPLPTSTDKNNNPLPERSSDTPASGNPPKLRRSTRRRRKSRKQREADGEIDAVNVAVVTPGGELSVGSIGGVPWVAAKGGESGSPDANAVLAILPDPLNYREAHQSPEAEQWTKAELEELQALIANATWTLIKCEPAMTKLHSKWVYKKKRDSNGSVQRYKARLVACGNEQILGVNYTLTFAAVLEMTSVKVIFVLAHIWGVRARHGDVPNAYVKAMTEDGIEIVLAIPQGMDISAETLAKFGVRDAGKLGLRLNRSLYGLKQAGRLWHQLLHRTMVELGFTQCITDTCIYFKADSDGITVVGTYVDDLLVTASSPERVDDFFCGDASTLAEGLRSGSNVSWSSNRVRRECRIPFRPGTRYQRATSEKWSSSSSRSEVPYWRR